MADKKQEPYPGETPPAYPGPTTVESQAQGYLPPPGAAPPPGYSQPGHPPVGYQPYPEAGLPSGTYYPGQPVAVQPVIGQPMVIVSQNQFGPYPVNTVCPHCSQNVVTSTKAEAGGLAWLVCAGMCVVGLWFGCCLIPFCIDACQDIRHSCPNCKNTVHVFGRM